MRAVVLHLSDIHFKSKSDPITSRVEKIADTLNVCSDEEFACFIVISGDIANSGAAEEYNVASEFLSSLREQISKNNNINHVHIIAIPGNHDCDFSTSKSTRNALIGYLQENDTAINNIDFNYVKDITSVQSNYFEFAKSFQNTEYEGNSLYYLSQYEVDNYRILFQCFNTAWMSSKKEDQGTLLFPVHLVDFANYTYDNQILVISVFHHPYNWFDSRHRKAFQNLVNKYSNVIITGHEHDIDSYTKLDIRGQVQEIMQGGLLHCGNEGDSSFNIEVIDLQNRTQKKYLLVWDDNNDYYKIDEETGLQPFLSLETREIYSLKQNFEKTLRRLDVQISHPHFNTPLEIDDIHVNPSIEIEYIRKGIILKNRERTKSLSRFVEIIKECKQVLVLGSKYYGKSILLKKLYKFFLEDDIVPLYCEGKQLSELARNIDSAVRDLFDEQYENAKGVPYGKYRQLPMDKKALLIDDIYTSGLGVLKIEGLLGHIQKHFGLLVLTSSPNIDLDEMFTGHGALIEYSRAILSDFGFPTISEMVEKWTRLSNPEDQEEEIQHKIKSLEHNLFNVLGKSIIPRNPFFIITILYNIVKSGSPDAQTGAYGYYFQTIINVVVAKIAERPNLIAYIYDYFSSLAFQMFDNKTGKIDKVSLGDLNAEYLDRTGFDLNLDQIIDNAIKEDMLRDEGDSYSFTYNYYFEYFVANYVGSNIKNPKMQESILHIVEQMALHLHKDVYSNIMMFICFHGRDPLVLDIVIDKATSIFRSIGRFTIPEDVDFMNKLSPFSKVRTLSGKPREETKREMLEAQDSAIEEIGELRHNLSMDVKNLEELSIISRILYAFAAVKVLGQMIRMYIPGNLEDRIRLTKECYDLGLKTIKYVMDEIKHQIPELQDGLAQCILERNPSINSDELGQAVNNWIWALSESICASSIKNISGNVGAPELKRVYKLILDRYPDIAYEFIDISIELDHYKELPESKILSLAKRLDESKNYFCKDLLSLLFIHHVYQFYTPPRKRQRIAAALGLEFLLTAPNVFLPGQKLLPRSTS